jgi:hypothetical protein
MAHEIRLSTWRKKVARGGGGGYFPYPTEFRMLSTSIQRLRLCDAKR